MKLKLSESQFGRRCVEVLGHRVTQNGIMPSEEHLSSVKTLLELSNGQELLIFLGLANYFSEDLEDFAMRAKPLYDVFVGCRVNKKKSKNRPICSTMYWSLFTCTRVCVITPAAAYTLAGLAAGRLSLYPSPGMMSVASRPRVAPHGYESSTLPARAGNPGTPAPVPSPAPVQPLRE